MGTMKQQNKKFQLIITSPPYNAKKIYENNLLLDEYKTFARSWIDAACDLLSENGSLWLNVGYMKVGSNRTIPLTYLYYEICKLPFVQEIVWHFEGGMSYKKRFTHRTERWMWFAKNPDKVKFNLDSIRSYCKKKDARNNPLGKNPTDYWYFDRVTNNNKQKTEHPCQFPTAMISRIIRACSDAGDVVLDPFMGSGSVGVSCVENNRSFVGIEISKRYCKIAKERLDKVLPSIWDDDGNMLPSAYIS